MLPKIELVADVDVVAMSPLLRGMVMAMSYADTEGGIGLTAIWCDEPQVRALGRCSLQLARLHVGRLI